MSHQQYTSERHEHGRAFYDPTRSKFGYAPPEPRYDCLRYETGYVKTAQGQYLISMDELEFDIYCAGLQANGTVPSILESTRTHEIKTRVILHREVNKDTGAHAQRSKMLKEEKALPERIALLIMRNMTRPEVKKAKRQEFFECAIEVRTRKKNDDGTTNVIFVLKCILDILTPRIELVSRDEDVEANAFKRPLHECNEEFFKKYLIPPTFITFLKNALAFKVLPLFREQLVRLTQEFSGVYDDVLEHLPEEWVRYEQEYGE